MKTFKQFLEQKKLGDPNCKSTASMGKLDGKKGAGEWGTDKLKNKFKKDTPKQ